MATATITINVDATAGGTTQAPVWMSATAPATPGNGTLWFNTTIGRMFVYYDDGNTTQWVEV